MGTVLLFHVNIIKANQIIGLCKKMNYTTYIIPKEDYSKPLGVLAKIEGMKSGAVYKGAEFDNEMMVLSGISSEEVDRFLDEYKQSGIAPIQRKAVVTPSNVKWSAEKLYTELDKHVLS